MTFHFAEFGDGRPVLALHGFTPDHRLMTGCLEPIFMRRPGFRRLYPDLPGMGATPASPTLASTDDVLAELETFIGETIGEQPFVLVGESWGGYLARALTRSRPAQVLGVALICPLGVAPQAFQRTLPAHQALRRDPGLMSTLEGQLASEFAAIAVVQTPETLRRFREEVMSGLEVADEPALARILQRYALSFDPEDGPPYTRPALILTGRQDSTVGYADQFPLLAHYPRATYAALDLAGHNLQIEQPALFEALIDEWLDRVLAEA